MKRILLFLLTAATCLAAGPVAAERPAVRHATRIADQAGRGIGFGGGVLVTAALAVSKRWNAPLTDGAGRPRTIRVDGTTYVLRQRHSPVVGPRILQAAGRVGTHTPVGRVLQTFLNGVAAGATAAPPATARWEAKFLKFLGDL